MKETSAYIAKMAARGIKNPAGLSAKAIKAICASALSQTEDDVLPPWDKLSPTKQRRLEAAMGQLVFGESNAARYNKLRKIMLS